MKDKTTTVDMTCCKCDEVICKKGTVLPYGYIKFYCSKYHETKVSTI